MTTNTYAPHSVHNAHHKIDVVSEPRCDLGGTEQDHGGTREEELKIIVDGCVGSKSGVSQVIRSILLNIVNHYLNQNQ